MSIETDQISMSEKFTEGQSTGGEFYNGVWDSKQSGYFADDGRYPDNRVTWAHGDVVTTQTTSVEDTAAVWSMRVVNNVQESYISEAATYKTTLSDGIATSQAAGKLSLPGEV